MVFESRIWQSILFLILGLVLLYSPNQNIFNITQETAGIIIIIFSLIFLVNEVLAWSRNKKAKPVTINHPQKARIGNYLERNKIKYIYKPKEEPQLDFFLPEYDVYVKYWMGTSNKKDRDKLRKKLKSNETKLIEVYEDNLETEYKLHSAFMKKGFRLMKRR